MVRVSNSSLWADVVRNLALLTVLTIVLNAVVIGRIVQGREMRHRATMAGEIAHTIASRVADEVHRADLSRLVPGPNWEAVLKSVVIPEDDIWFAVLTTPSLEPLGTVGWWPPELSEGQVGSDGIRQRALTTWLLEAVDLRAALGTRRVERGEWQRTASFVAGRSYVTATAPVLGAGHVVLGAVRVAAPVGIPFLGPMDRHVLPVLLVSTLISASLVGLFGYLLFRRRILQPIEALVASTQEVAGGAFDTRLQPDAANELGELAAAFNDMATKLQDYRTASEGQLAELMAINKDLSQAREDLIFAEKMATVGRLAAGVAHEVGNPLASVIGFVDLLEQDPDGEMAEDLLPRIRNELDRIHGIIRDLLDYAKPTGLTQPSMKAVGDRPEIDLAEVLDNAAKLVTVQPRFSKVRFEVELGGRLPALRLPADRLQQVLLNLFVNAAEAMAGAGTIRVARVGDPEADRDGFVVLSVADEGPGIDPRVNSNIYEPFFTNKEVGGGTGLGLSVSLRLVEKMGGELKHLRDQQGGACFHISLPTADRASGQGVV